MNTEPAGAIPAIIRIISIRTTIRRCAVTLAIILSVIFAAPALAGSAEGVAAYNRGDNATALREFRPLAEQGAAKAQYNLGLMYEEGQGVSQDYAEAVRWFRKAAEQGHDEAQFSLGVMYLNGLGVPQDHVLAHMWFNLSAARGNELAGSVRKVIGKTSMTPAQIAEAQRLAREWKPRKK